MGSRNRGARRASRSALAFVLSAVMLINTWPADAIAEAISEAGSVTDAESSAALVGSSEEVGDTARDDRATGSLCIDVRLVDAPEWALWQDFEVVIEDGEGRLLDADGHWVSPVDADETLPRDSTARYAEDFHHVVSAAQPLVLEGVPTGTYTVTELDEGRSVEGYEFDAAASVVQTSVTVGGSATSEVTLQNTYRQASVDGAPEVGTESVAGDTTATDGSQTTGESDEGPRNTLSTLTFEDADVRVTATPARPDVLPAGCRLVVTQVTSDSAGYSYDAYMGALNATTDDEDTYTERNTILFDVAFYATDEDGNDVEVRPDEGDVTVAFEFRRAQLRDQIDAPKAEDVTVTHLTLSDEAVGDAQTTQEVTDAAATDVSVEAVEQVLATDSDRITLTVDDFSVYGFSYTVDFVHDDYAWSIPGDATVTLQDLFENLAIEAGLDFVRDVAFSDAALVEVACEDGSLLVSQAVVL